MIDAGQVSSRAPAGSRTPRIATGPAGVTRRASSASDDVREVAAPAAGGGNGSGRDPEQREAGRVRQPGNAALLSDHFARATEPGVRGLGAGVLDRDELGQILRGDDVGRHGEGGLVVLAAHKRRAVGLREEREAEADDQERHRHRRPAGIPRERERRQPDRDGPAGSGAADQPERRREGARAGDGRDERDERRQEDQHRARSALRGQVARVRRAAREAENDRDQCPERGHVDERERSAAEPDRRRPEAEEEHCRGPDRQRARDRKAFARQQRVGEHGARRRTGAIGEERRDHRPQPPAEHRPERGDGAPLSGSGGQQLRAPGAEPRQPPPRGLDVAAQARRRQHGEREEQRGGLPADQEQPPPGDHAGGVRRLHLLDGREQVEELRAGLEVGPHAGDGAGERIDRPRMDRAAGQRHHPVVAAIRVGERRRLGDPTHAVREQERRRRGRVVALRLGQNRSDLVTRDEILDRERRGETAAADDDQPQRPGRSGSALSRRAGRPRTARDGRAQAGGRSAA